MRVHQRLLLACLFLLPAGLLPGQNPPTEDRAPEGVEVLARGPVHEAFAQPPDVGVPEGGAVIPKEPPEAVEELPPEQKPEGGVQWLPGYWQWDAERGEFLWISGAWREPPPGRQWVPGHWRQVDGGWQWITGFWAPASQDDLSYQPPPPESLETGPSLPPPADAEYFYSPGCWVYRQTRYFWRPGYWARHRPGWVWVPSRYVWTPAGCVFVNGYWDYPLDRRGLLFAPVCFTRPFRGPWAPSYVVSASFLPGALFVEPEHRHYCFGDYFGSRYRRAGFTPWVDFRIGRSAVDPLFAYYRHSGGRDWERNTVGLYAARADGRLAPPPRTLGQQTSVVRELRQRTTDAQRIRSATVLTPLADVPRHATALTTVSREERIRHQRAAGQLGVAARERSRTEQGLLSRREAPVRPSASPRPVPFEMPRAARSTRPAERVLPGAPASPSPRSLPREVRPRDLERRPVPHQELPPPTRRETAPVPRREAVPPPRHEAPPLPRRETVPTPRRDVTPPPRRETRHLEQRREPPPSPRPPAQSAPERPRTQPPAPRQVQPPPAPRRVEPPPPSRPAQQPRIHQAPPPPAPKHVPPPPPSPARHAAPPPPKPAQHAPPSPGRAAPASHAKPPKPKDKQR